jgi:hypothetical protein
MEKPNKKYEDDDGRVICNMNVEGTRWHDKNVRRRQQAARKMPSVEQMSRSETWRFTWSAVLAGLLIVLVFSVTWVLFILFCTKIWFR